ncbi:unnamed protein product [Rhizoctonia solani]|uniref:Uncharacterized protein n=1 Tax=Rhizoctonia solani TaxID=456999 RepID=A0A8H3D081_9AGAM|nr:unnamed protein product [Rhizoctonia solani]
MAALRSISKLLRGETDLERHRRRMRYYTWLVDVFRIDGSVTLRILGPVLTVTLFATFVATMVQVIDGSVTLRILGPVLTVTLFATFVATMVQVHGHNWRLTNNVVPLLSVVVGLILVFRNGTSYDRYYEGRKDFGTLMSNVRNLAHFGTLMSNVRNLARMLWVNANLPHASEDVKAKQPSAFMKIRGRTYQPSSSIKNPVITSASLRAEKERALKLMVAFVVAVKHHLRNEEGVDHSDYLGLLPADFSRFDNRGFNKSGKHGTRDYTRLNQSSAIDVPHKNGNASGHSQGLSTSVGDMDATLVPGSVPRSPHKITFFGNKGAAPDPERDPLLRGESTTVEFRPYTARKSLPMPLIIAHELTRLIHKFRRSGMLELLRGESTTVEFRPYTARKSLPMPLIIAHELTRLIHKFRRSGMLDTIGPAGVNAMNTLIQSMIDQVTAMERVSNTPIPVSYSIHLKQCVTLYLFSLPFTLIGDLADDSDRNLSRINLKQCVTLYLFSLPFTLIGDLGWRMIPIVTLVAYTLMGIEGIANEIEMPFGRDPSDLPLDRYCTELRDEIEYMMENLAEGDDDLESDDEH